MKTYTYPQETWNEAKCNKMANHRRADGFGNKGPKGIIAGSASSYPEYGQVVRFNGGTIIDNELFDAVCVPLPKIPDSFEFVNVVSWGHQNSEKGKGILIYQTMKHKVKIEFEIDFDEL